MVEPWRSRRGEGAADEEEKEAEERSRSFTRVAVAKQALEDDLATPWPHWAAPEEET